MSTFTDQGFFPTVSDTGASDDLFAWDFSQEPDDYPTKPNEKPAGVENESSQKDASDNLMIWDIAAEVFSAEETAEAEPIEDASPEAVKRAAITMAYGDDAEIVIPYFEDVPLIEIAEDFDIEPTELYGRLKKSGAFKATEIKRNKHRYGERDQIILDANEAGKPIADIAAEMKIGAGTVYSVLDQAFNPKERKSTPDMDACRRNAKFVELYQSGMTYDEIAEQENVNRTTVYQAVRRINAGDSGGRRAANAERDAKIVEMYKTGMVCREIAEQMNLTHATVYQIVRKADVIEQGGRAMRGRKAAEIREIAAANRQAAKEQRNQQLVELYMSGMTYDEVSEATGISRSTVYQAVKSAGLLGKGGRTVKSEAKAAAAAAEKAAKEAERAQLERQIIGAYLAGFKYAEIEEETGLNRTTIYQILKKADVIGQGGANRPEDVPEDIVLPERVDPNAERDAGIIEAYMEGAKYQEIADEFSMSYSSVYQVLRKAGVIGQGGATVRKEQAAAAAAEAASQRAALKEERNAKIIEAYLDGATYQELEERFGISRASVYQVLKRSGALEEKAAADKAADDVIVGMYLGGAGYAEIEEKIGCSSTKVYKVVKDAGYIGLEDREQIARRASSMASAGKSIDKIAEELEISPETARVAIDLFDAKAQEQHRANAAVIREKEEKARAKEERDAQIIEAYKDGLTYAELEEKFSLNRTSIYQILKRSGAVGSERKSRASKCDPKVAGMYLGGAGYDEICETTGYSRSKVYTMLKNSGYAGSEDRYAIAREIANLFDIGMPLSDIANTLGLDPEIVTTTALTYETKKRKPAKKAQSAQPSEKALARQKRNEEIIAAYQEGMKYSELEEKFGLNRASIYQIIKKSGVERRRNADGTSTDAAKVARAEREAKIIEMVKNGSTRNEILEETGVNLNVYYAALKSAGIPASSVKKKREPEKVVNVIKIETPTMSGAERREIRNKRIVEAYRAGRGYDELCEEFGVSRATVYKALNEAGVGKRMTKKREQQIADNRAEIDAQIVEKYLSGKSYGAISSEMKLPLGRVKATVKASGYSYKDIRRK